MPTPRRSFSLLAAILLSLYVPQAPGQSVQLAHPDALRPNSWELLAVRITAPPGGGTITLRDARGGPLITRSFPHGASRILLPFPAIAPADLPSNPPRWPLDLILIAADHSSHASRIDVLLPSPDVAPTALRLALPMDLDAVPPAVAALFGPRTEIVHVTDDDLLNGPTLLFAACDAIYLPHRLTQNFPEERAAALAATGVRLLATEDDEAGLAALRRLAWVHVSRSDGAPAPSSAPSTDPLWEFPALPFPRPVPIEPGLVNIPDFLAPAPADTRTRTLLALIPLESLISLFLAVGIFRRDRLLLSVFATAMIALATANIALLHAHTPEARRQARWTAGGAGLRAEETLFARATLFPQSFSADAQDGEILSPLWPSSSAFFAQTGLRLDLDQPSDLPPARQSRLHASLGLREGVAFLQRTPHIDAAFHAQSAADVLRLDPATADGAWWILAGHLAPASADPPAVALDAPSFAQWLSLHLDFAPDARAWYELRFDVRSRYLLLAPPGAPPHFFTLPPASAP